MTGKQFHDKGILIICGIYLLVSAVLFFAMTGGQVIIGNDSMSYIQPARHIIDDLFFSQDGIHPDFNRTPGYPLFLALVYWLGGSDTAVVILQIFLMTLKVYLFYRILITLNTPKNLALFGSSLLLINVQSYGYSLSILTEPLFGFLLLLSVYFLAVYLYAGRNLLFFGGFSIALNYALLVRPILLYFNLLLCFVLVILSIVRKIRVNCCMLFLACWVLMFGGWSFRNYLHSGVFTLSTIQDHDFATLYVPKVKAYIQNIPFNPNSAYVEGISEENYKQLVTEYPEINDTSLNEAQKSLLYRNYAKKYLMNHFGAFIALNLRGWVTQMFSSFGTNLLRRSTGASAKMLLIQFVQICFCIFLYSIYIFYFAGLIRNRHRNAAIHIGIFLLSAYLSLPAAIYAATRFRDPFLPLLLLSAVNNSGTLIRSLCEKTRIPSIKRVGEYLLESNTDLCRKDVNI